MKNTLYILFIFTINFKVDGQCGDPKFSDLTGRFRANPSATVGVYPNPSTGIVNIKSDFLLISDLKIYNTSNKKVLEVPVYKMQDKVDLSSLVDGVYMIKFTNFNYTISKTVMISQGLKSFSIYPNPTTGIINLQSETELGTVSIYNQAGQLISQQTTKDNTLQFDLRLQESGTYIIKVGISSMVVIKQ
ncbi:MAG: T9SS type A sorting domain-containing protein [Bacteroidia bacterium]